MRPLRWIKPFIAFGMFLFLAGCGAGSDSKTPALPSFAFFYAQNPPISELQAFDRVILDPASVDDPVQLPTHTRWYAYVSVGELDPSRPWAGQVPSGWLLGENPAWGSQVIDQTAPGWADFFLDRIIAPLWQSGWRGFFFDTLDSYQLFAQTPLARKAQEEALVALIERLHARYPGIDLIFNRGFEILPQLKGKVSAVVAESLFQKWDNTTQSYREVPEEERRLLIERLNSVRNEHDIPVVVIDYAPLTDRAAAVALAARIHDLGFVPWVAAPRHDALGVGEPDLRSQ